MATCEYCGNHYDNAFEVIMNGRRHVFDCFECAIQMLATTCSYCGCRIMGHGATCEDAVFCCANCASQYEETAFREGSTESVDPAGAILYSLLGAASGSV